MNNILLSRAPRAAIPVTLVPSENFQAWLKKQKPHVVNWLKTVDFTGKPGRFCIIPDNKGKAGHVIVGLSSPVSMWDLAGLPRCLPKGAYMFSGKVPVDQQEKLALGWLLGGYRFTRYKKNDGELTQLVIPSEKIVAKVEHMADAIMMARDLINTPANDLGPAELAKAVIDVGKKFGAKVTQIVGDDLLRKKFVGIHTVGRASPKKPRLVDLTWGNPRHPKVTLIGKGVCFDTGGLDIKPSSNMQLMKKDMAGAACALAVAKMIMAQKLPVRLRLLVPAVENSVGGDAYRPSDILKMHNGMTVEIGNTDAEGRLVMADAMSLASQEKPDLIVDFSTLTGAARSALGTKISALFCNDDKLAHALQEAGEETEDHLWRMPLYAPYESMLDSQTADISSSANSPYAGAITAALFLQRFIGKKQKWAHLDFMAWNTASKPGRPEGAEPMGVRAVYRVIEKLARKP